MKVMADKIDKWRSHRGMDFVGTGEFDSKRQFDSKIYRR